MAFSRFTARVLATATCTLAIVVAAATAEDTTETTTFGEDGIATQSLGPHFEETRFLSVEARPDGGIVAQRDDAGPLLRGVDQLESYLPNGAPDPAAPPRQVSSLREVFPLASGRSLVAEGPGLTRVNADGSVDASFGNAGTIKPPVEADAAMELPSGKILLAGVTSGGTKGLINTLEVALVNQDGSVDQSLGGKGVLRRSLPSNFIASVAAVAPTDQGGALVVGSGFLFELRADGSPNSAFGSDGLVVELPALVSGRVLADGSIEAVGSGTGPTGEDLLVLRYTPAGSPDTGFGADGIRSFDLGGEERAHTALWAADGSVVVGGSSSQAGPCEEVDSCEEVPLLAAFDPAGGLDPGFGDGGVLRLISLAGAPGSWFHEGPMAMTRRPDGSIVVAGSAPPRGTVAFLAALSPTGALLPGFGDGGIVRVRQPVPASQAVAGLARLADGKLLAAGATDVGIENAPALVRYNADGSLDRSFGGGAGYVTLDSSSVARGFAVGPSGQALIGISGYPRSKLVLRTADGEAVRSFGSDGVVQLPRRVRVEALGLDRDGGAVVVGSRDVSGSPEPGVVLRFRPDGTPDSGFGRDGRVALRPGGKEMKARALVTGSRGRMLVGGITGRGFAVVRLLPSGRPDPHFGVGGLSLPRVGGVAKSMTLNRVGSRIYLAGVARSGDRLRVVLMRFHANGRLDPGFGHRGRRTVPIAESAQPEAILPARSGVLVVLGKGKQPLLLFSRGDKVRRPWVGDRSKNVANVRAIASDGRLLLSWNAPSPTTRRDVHYLASRPLP